MTALRSQPAAMEPILAHRLQQGRAVKAHVQKGNKNQQETRPSFWHRVSDHPWLLFFSKHQSLPHQLQVCPPDPWPGQVTLGRQIISGQYRFFGAYMPKPFQWKPENASPDWVAALHGFEWLRDLRAVGGDAARRHARGLTQNWLQHFKRWDPVAWRPDLVGTRLAAWIGLHDFFLSSADDAFRQQVFAAILKQSRYLARVLPGALRGAPLIAALKGQIFATLALPQQQIRLMQALTLLNDEIARQILPDGGHIERNPVTHLQVLRHIIDIRTALRCAGLEVPQQLHQTIQNMAAMVRFYCHGDYHFAHFNGAGDFDPGTIESVLQQAHAGPKPALQAPHTGYERIILNRSILFFDVGRLPPAGYDSQAHVAPLSFEFSVGRERLIVNCGHGGSLCKTYPLSHALRCTAAHSTVTLADTNAAEMRPEGGIGRQPKTIHLHRDSDKDFVHVTAAHDGYHGNLGVLHKRELYLCDNGEDLRGQDILTGSAGHAFAARFHIHPDVKASLTGNNAAVLLRTRSGAGWRFKAAGAALSLEESVYLSQPGETPRKTQQIVLKGHMQHSETAVKWSLKREKKTRAATTKKTTLPLAPEPEPADEEQS